MLLSALLPFWRLALDAAGKSPKTISSYLDSAKRLEAYLTGVPRRVRLVGVHFKPGVQGLHRPHPDGLPGPAAPIPRRAGVPAGQRPDAR